MAFVQIDVSAELQGVGGPMTAVEMAMVQSSLQLHIRISQRYCMLAASSSNASLRACTTSRYRSGQSAEKYYRSGYPSSSSLILLLRCFWHRSLSLSLSLSVCVCVCWLEKSFARTPRFCNCIIKMTHCAATWYKRDPLCSFISRLRC
jgi:hypothetical protein